MAYAALGEVRRAIEHYEQALVISREIGDRRGEGNQSGQPGQCVCGLGRGAAGHRVPRAGLGDQPGDRRPPRRGAHLGNLGKAYAALGEVRRAIEYYEQALVISREIGDRRGEGNDLGNLGMRMRPWARCGGPSSTTSRPW